MTSTQPAVNSNELFGGVSERNAKRANPHRFTFEGTRPLAERKGFELFRNTQIGAYHYAKSKIPVFGLRTHTEVITFHRLRALVAWLERQPDAA